jgi:FkbM family methyltransferase
MNAWSSFVTLIRLQHRLDRMQRQLETRTQQQLDLLQRQLGHVQQQLGYVQEQLEYIRAIPLRGAVYVGNNRVLVRYMADNRVIGYLVEADDLLLAPWFILSGQFETDVTKFFVESLKSDSRCLDIGANFGFYTCLMGRFCPNGKVIGVEPAHTVYQLLRDNILINGLNGHCGATQAAVAESAGRLTLNRRILRSANTSIVEPSEALMEYHGETAFERFEVKSITVDDLLVQFDNRIDFIKIDVEGAEPLVLRGAANTISANPQLNIIMEWSPDQIRDAGFDINEFISEIDSMGLAAAVIGASGVNSVPLSELLNISYAAGILLRRPTARTTMAGSTRPAERR